MMAEKFDFKANAYKPYVLPKGAVLTCDKMDDVVNCASCGRKIRYGDGYCSLAIHNKYGIGYSVCKECYENEKADARNNCSES